MTKVKPAFLIPGGPSADPKQSVEDFRTALCASGKSDPIVAYVGTASHDDQRFFAFMKTPLMQAGAHSVCLAPLVGKSADIEKARKILVDADVVFLSGGEPEDGMDGLKSAGLDSLIVDLYRQGKLLIGVSAGAIMMGRYWVHWDVKGDDSTAHLIDCLGLFPLTFDAHGEQEDWHDLRCALSLMEPGAQGYGLSTGGLYCINEQGVLKTFRNGPDILEASE